MYLTQMLLAANLLVLAGLGGWLFVLQKQAKAAKAGAEWLAADAGALPPDLRERARDAGIADRPFYTIEILNPLEVAALESRLGAMFSGITPAIVTREVHRRAYGIITEQLGTYGIKADVRLHA